MANSEAQFQKELLDSCGATQHCHAFKVSDKFAAGRPDLYIKHLEFPSTWLELKFGRASDKERLAKNGFILNLTSLQRRFLELENDAGGVAGWALCVKVDHTWVLYAGRHHAVERVAREHFVQIRTIGQNWSIGALLSHLHQQEES